LNTGGECNARRIKFWIFRLGSSLDIQIGFVTTMAGSLELVSAGSWGCVLEVHATMGRFGGSGFPRCAD
jgi:hypothetical protein